MEKISEYGYLTMHEVQFIFGNKTWAYKVMKGLRSQEFIADHDTLMSPRTAHYLTPKGYRVLVKLGRLKVGWRFKPERYSVFIFRHRMACAKVGLLLEKHPLVHEFLPESRLFKRRKSENDKLCDGEFWYKVEGNPLAERVGLEVELTLKSNSRLDESLRQLGRRNDLDQVWWICADENVRRAMRREVQRRYLGSQRHFFALMDEFMAAKGKAELMEPNGTLLAIDPIQPTLLPRPPEPPPRPPAPPPAPAPLPLRMAQAEAPKSPEPAPIPADEPSLARRFFVGLGSLALRLLKWSWRWLRESWSLYRDYESGWELEFHRWPHVWTVAALAAGLAIYGHWPALVKVIDPPPPPPTWYKRRLRRPSVAGPNWTLNPLALSSAAGRYRFRAELIANNYSRVVCGAAVVEVQGRELADLSWKELRIGPGYRLDPDLSFEFKGSRSMNRFFVVLSEGRYRCDETEHGETFLVQFE